MNFLGNPMAARAPRAPYAVPKPKLQIDPYKGIKLPRFDPGVAPASWQDTLAGAGGFLGAQQEQPQMAPMPQGGPIQVDPLDPNYQFRRFRFQFGNNTGLLG